MQMPFGKYKGWSLEDVPDDYLVWVLDYATSAGPTLKAAIRQRLGLDPQPQPAPGASYASDSGLPTDRVRQSVQSWYRRMAMKYHPDRGGSDAQMQAIGEAYQELLRILAL